MAICKYCNEEIHWMKEGRKNVPVERDGGVHKCEQMTASLKSIKKMEPSEIDPEILKQYQASMNEAAKKSKKKK